MTDGFIKLEVYVPIEHAEELKSALFAAGAGEIGNYDCCCWQTSGTGQFRPLAGSNAFIGEKDKVEKVAEVKIETICSADKLDGIISALKETHPYETPAFQYWAVKTD